MAILISLGSDTENNLILIILIKYYFDVNKNTRLKICEIQHIKNKNNNFDNFNYSDIFLSLQNLRNLLILKNIEKILFFKYC